MGMLRALLVQIGADIRPLTQGLAGAVEQVNKSGKKIDSALDIVRKGFAGLGVALGTREIYGFVKGSLDASDALVDLADTVGLTTDQIQELRYSAVMCGLEVAEFDAAITRAATNVGDARNGTGQLVGTIERLGIKLSDSSGYAKSLSDVLDDVADKIAHASNEQEQLSIATDFFGKSAAPGMVRALRDGKDGLKKFADEARNLGIVMDEQSLRHAKELDEKWNRLIYISKQLAKEGVVKVATVGDASSDVDKYIHNKLGHPADTSGFTKAVENQKKLQDMLKSDPTNESIKKSLGALNQVLDVWRKLYHIRRQISDLEQNPKSYGPWQPGDSVQGPWPKVSSEPMGPKLEDKQTTLREINTVQTEYNSLLDEGRQLTESLRTPEEVRNAAMERLSYLLSEGAISQETFLRGTIQLNEQMDGVADSAEEMGSKISLQLDESVKGFGKAILSANSFGSALGNVLNRMGELSIDTAFDSLVGKGKLIDFGSIIKNVAGARASGGPVLSGQPYLVGERGPELMVPNNSGYVVPNGQLGGRAQSQPTTIVHQTLNLTTGVPETVRAEMMRMLPAINRSTVAAVNDANKRTLR